MKNLSTFLILLFVINLQAQWEVQDTGLNNYLIDIHCITSDSVVVVGGSGVILRTTDGGLHWNQMNSPVNENLIKIDFINPGTGFILSNNNTLLKTIDGGENWQILNTNFSDNILNISCTDTALYVSGDNAMFYKSDDLGLTWTNINTGLQENLNIEMEDDNTGFVMIGNQLYKTTDGGNTWNLVTCVSDYNAFMGDQLNGILINEYNYYLSDDGFQTCHVIEHPTEAFPFDDNITFTDSGTFWFPSNIMACMYIQPVAVKYEYDESTGTGQYTYCDLLQIATGYFDLLDEQLILSGIDSYNDTVYIITESSGLIFKNPTGINCNDFVNAIENINADVISVYPNPNKGIFNLKAEKLAGFTYRILDLQGKELVPETQTGEKSIDVSFLPAGVYLIELTGREGVFTQKLIIE